MTCAQHPSRSCTVLLYVVMKFLVQGGLHRFEALLLDQHAGKAPVLCTL